MKISARNSFKGTITNLTPGAVNSEVIVNIGGGDTVTAIITNGSAQGLALAKGKEVVALVKASSILLMTDSTGYKLSARNTLAATVQSVTPGAVNAEVSLKLGGGAEVHAIVTNDSVKELGLTAGKPATVVIKASSVILGVAA
jgi:molybdate transport system regulatory protein